MRSPIFFIIAVFCILTSAQAQSDFKPGYIITNESDTIRGLINLKSNKSSSELCIFKESIDSKSNTYSPKEIRGYRIDEGKLYISKTIKLEDQEMDVFLEFFVNGIVNLYYLKFNKEDYYFIEEKGVIYNLENNSSIISNPNGNRHQIQSNQYIGALKYTFRDAPSLMAKIENTGFAAKDLITLTKEYHELVCDEYGCIDYTKSTSLNAWLEPVFGMNLSYLRFKTSKDYAFNSSFGFGFNFRKKPFNSIYRWNVWTGIHFAKNEFAGSYSNTIFIPQERLLSINLDYACLQIPLGLEYTFPLGNIKPTLSLAYLNSFIIYPDYEIISISTSRNNRFPLDSEFRTYQYGFSVGMGIKHVLNNSNQLNIKANVEYRKPMANFNQILDYHYVTTINISCGYAFRLN